MLPDVLASGRSTKLAPKERSLISKKNKKSTKEKKTKKQSKIIHKRNEQQSSVEKVIAHTIARLNEAEGFTLRSIFEKEYGSNYDTMVRLNSELFTFYGCPKGFKSGVRIYLKNIYSADFAMYCLKLISSGVREILPLRLTKNKTKFFYGKHRLHLDRCIFSLHLRELQEKR